jgi:outer membrane lipoprotein SlyB
MKRIILTAGLAASALPLALSQPAFAHEEHAQSQQYSGSTTYTECRKSSGTTGLAIGGVAGGLIGAATIGGGLLGPLIGAVGGAFAGRAIDRESSKAKRCRVVHEDEPREPAYRAAPTERDDLYESGPSER